jgi:hypothetical protein
MAEYSAGFFINTASWFFKIANRSRDATHIQHFSLKPSIQATQKWLRFRFEINAQGCVLILPIFELAICDMIKKAEKRRYVDMYI